MRITSRGVSTKHAISAVALLSSAMALVIISSSAVDARVITLNPRLSNVHQLPIPVQAVTVTPVSPPTQPQKPIHQTKAAVTLVPHTVSTSPVTATIPSQTVPEPIIAPGATTGGTEQQTTTQRMVVDPLPPQLYYTFTHNYYQFSFEYPTQWDLHGIQGLGQSAPLAFAGSLDDQFVARIGNSSLEETKNNQLAVYDRFDPITVDSSPAYFSPENSGRSREALISIRPDVTVLISASGSYLTGLNHVLETLHRFGGDDCHPHQYVGSSPAAMGPAGSAEPPLCL